MEEKENAVPAEPFEIDPQSVSDPFDNVYWKTVSINTADDYYILFRDPTPFEEGDDVPLNLSVLRKRLEETLIVDQASFAWRYAGKLTQPQAEKVQDKINVVFTKRFNSPSCASKYLSSTEFGASELRRLRGFLLCNVNCDDTLWVVPHTPGALTFLAQKYPKLDYLSRLPVNHCVRLLLEFENENLLESDMERLHFREELFQRASQDDASFSFYFGKCYGNSAYYKGGASIRLVPSSALGEFSESVDMRSRNHHSCASNMNTLRLVTAITYSERSFSGHREEDIGLDIVEEIASIKASFNTFIATQPLIPFHQEVLKKCVDIANSVREKDDCINRGKSSLSGGRSLHRQAE